MENRGVIFEKRDFFYALFKHRIKISFIIIIAMLVSTAGVYVWPKSYEAKAQLIVKLGRENVSVPSAIQPVSPVVTSGVTKDDINSEIEIVKSRIIAERAIKAMGLDYLFPQPVVPATFFGKIKFYIKTAILWTKELVFSILYKFDLLEELAPFDRGVKAIQKKLKVTSQGNSAIIDLRLRWDSPEKSVMILKTLLDEYLKRHTEIHSTLKTSMFFKEQLSEYKDKLVKSENELESFKKNNDISIIALEKQILLEQLGKTHAELQEAASRLRETQGVISNLQRQIKGQVDKVELSADMERNPVVDSYKMKLMELETEMNRLLIKYPDSNPLVMNIKAEVDRIKKLTSDEEKSVAGTVKSGANSTLRGLQERLLSEENSAIASQMRVLQLEQHERKIKKSLDRLNSAEIKMGSLERERRLKEEYYSLYTKKFEEARISDVMDSASIANVDVLEPPLPPFAPIWPKKLVTIAATLIGSIVTGVIYALFLEYLNPSLKNENDVEHYLGLPHLLTIPEYSENNLKTVGIVKKDG